MTLTSPRAAHGAFGAVALVCSLGLSTSLGKSIWSDEAASLYSAHLGWSQLWQQSHLVDRVYLPYYAFLHIWVLVNSSVEWARIPSLVAYALTVVLIGGMGYRLRGFWCGIVAVALCASNPLMVLAALSIRPYALAALAATLSVTFLLRWFEDARSQQLWWFVVAAVAALAFQLFAVLAPLAALVVSLALRPALVKERWRHLVAPVGVLVAATGVFALYTIGQREQISWVLPFTPGSLVDALYGPAGGDSHAGRIAYTLVILCLVVFGLVVAIRSKSRLKARIARSDVDLCVIVAAWAVLPTIALIVVSFASPVYVSRYVTASAPGLALVVAMVTVEAYQLQRNRRPRTQLGRYAAVAAAVAVLFVSTIIAARFGEENVVQASAQLTKDVGSSGVAAFPNRLIDEEFETYLHGRHLALWPLVPHPRSFTQMDLRSMPSSMMPENVWIPTDASSNSAADLFSKTLAADGYAMVTEQKVPAIVPLYLEHFRR